MHKVSRESLVCNFVMVEFRMKKAIYSILSSLWGHSDTFQALSQLLFIPSSIAKSRLTLLGQVGHRSSISLGFDLTSHHPINVQLGQYMRL